MWREHRDVTEVAITLVVVQAVAHDEVGRDVEADVTAVHVHLRSLRLAQEREHLDRLGAARGEVLQQPAEGEAGVDHVLDDEHVLAVQIGVEVLPDLHHAAGLGARAIARHGHPVHRGMDGKRPRE
ncbi:hypothetical protein ABE10_01610, partial [Bacillus toyonensis]|nr:hypothetical protein [Bacillus toyonensis]